MFLGLLLSFIFAFNCLVFAAAAAPEKETHVLGERRLSMGSEGVDVEKLQSILKDKGFYSGSINGKFDEYTEKAVFEYQKSNSALYPYGVADFFTIRYLLTDSADTPKDNLTVGMLIPGDIHDGGYSQAGFDALLRIRRELNATIWYINDVPTTLDKLSEAIDSLAKTKPDIVMSHGGITAQAVENISKNYPDIQFVLSQGSVKGENLSVYQVTYDEATWLAGAAAGLLTKTNVIGHVSGSRVKGGVNARNAYANGVAYTNKDAKVLTTFTGDANDYELAKKTTEAQIEAGADIVFAMLGKGMEGVTDAVKENGIRQVAEVNDLSSSNPEVYILSALEDIGTGLVYAAKTYKEGKFESNVIKFFGLETEGALGIAYAKDVPQDIIDKIEELKNKIISKELVVSNMYDGEEFVPANVELKN